MTITERQMVLLGDEGGTTYLVWPLEHVRSDDTAIAELNRALDCLYLYLDLDEPDDRSCPFWYQDPPVPVSGDGTSGWMLDQGPWVHPDFADAGIAELIGDVLEGRRSDLPVDAMRRARVAVRTKHAEEVAAWTEEHG